MTEITEVRFDDLPGPLSGDDDVDGMVVIDGHHFIPFGEGVDDDGRTSDSFAVWSWNGNRDEPTLSPSVDLSDFHGHVVDGEFVPTDGGES